MQTAESGAQSSVSAASAPAASTSAGGSKGAGGDARPATSRRGGTPRSRSSERRLRQLVLRLRGCLAAIPPQQAKALELRTGIGLRRSYGRAEVARKLRVSSAREARIERTAVAALKSAARDGACATKRSARPATVLLSAPGPVAQQALPVALTTAPATSNPLPSSASPSAKDEERNGRRATAAPRIVPGASIPASFPAPGSGSNSFEYLALALLAATALAAPLALRARSRPAAAGP
ncbi:MAG TPA: hypothetical protein VMP89_18050, partial [Solirubrobacteraceae bacterium]|nr:hypothetical protein [Solirubrobacteraceae bacterium]